MHVDRVSDYRSVSTTNSAVAGPAGVPTPVSPLAVSRARLRGERRGLCCE